MSRFNHTIVAARDAATSAAFYRRLLEADEAPSWGPFVNIALDDGVLFQFAALPPDAFGEIQPQHYAFLVDDELFDRAVARIRADGRDHWADPQRTRPGETNTEHGGRGVYLLDPVGHYLELITRPYL
ncbi:VOC family protein [Actinomycetospora sp. OC33-EN08]|uniref:VOC family protein n=1 Tax=Actinomycetospora aurantiaca TaxID=3129233 RepID=A0ABU8MH03_9PSEU